MASSSKTNELVPYPDLPPRGWKSLEELNKQLEPLGLYLNSPEPAILCRTCKYALKPDGKSNTITRHLSKHSISLLQHKRLADFIRALRLPDPKTLPLRRDHSSPHPFLTAREGTTCSSCTYRTTSKDLFDRHVKKVHKVGGRKSRKQDVLRWERDDGTYSVLLQSWVENGSSGFWTVGHQQSTSMIGGGGAESAATQASLSRCFRLEQVHNLEQQRVIEQRFNTTVDAASSDMTLVNNWTHRTGWNELFRGEDWALLVRLTQLPQPTQNTDLRLGYYGNQAIISPLEDEVKLKHMLAAVDRALVCCRDTVRHTDISIRCWLRSQYPDRPYKAPFELPGRFATEVKYARVLKQCFSFWMRFWRLSESNKAPILRRALTARQREALEQAWTDAAWPSVPSLDTGPADPKDDEDDSEDEDYDEISDDDNNDDDDVDDDKALEEEILQLEGEEGGSLSKNRAEGEDLSNHEVAQGPTTAHPRDEYLTDLVLRLAYFLGTEEYEDGRSISTLLIYFSSVLGISVDGTTLERPLNYTPKLSAIIHCIRLILLESTLPRFAHSHIGWDARPRRGQLEVLNKLRVEKMCLGSQAPMGELLSLRSYGRAFSHSEGPSFRVHWSDDGQEVFWEKHRLTMSQFRRISGVVLEDARVYCKRLLYDWQPPCELMKVKDRLSSVAKGYSFVSDQDNELSNAYLELSRLACLAAADGLMTNDDWNMNAVWRYLKLHDDFLGLLMLLIFLFGGQVPRGTDLLAVEHYNSPSNRRGVCIYAGTVIIINTVNKARRATNREFYVARVLPKEVGELFYYYLVYIRPLYCMLYRRCLHTDLDTSLLFFSPIDQGKPWKTSRLTKGLKECTTKAIGFPIGVREYRQLTIAITEKHVKQISKPFNQYDDKSKEADINVAFAWQSGHRPLQRGVSYGLDGAFPDRLQPALLEVYRWVSGEWHKFLQQKDPAPAPDETARVGSKRSATMHETAKQTTKRLRQASPSYCRPTVDCWKEGDEEQGEEEESSGNSNEHGPWATQSELQILRKAPVIPWPGCLTLFGRPSQLERTDSIKEQQRIIEHVQTKEKSANRCFQSFSRLSFGQQFTRWRNVGCQICFANTGQPEPDHAMEECTLWESCGRAKDIHRWLEKLPIPKFTPGLGCCSLCTLTDSPCDAVRLGCRIAEAESPEVRTYFQKLLESRSSSDIHCENNPIVRKVIAALSAYDGQILGKVLARRFSEQDRVDFSAENQVSFWFTSRVPFQSDWVPRLLFVFEMLIWAFDFRSKERSKTLKVALHSRGQNELRPMGWDNKEEIQSWQESLEWWADKCGFCAGKGLVGAHINHTLRNCPRGGAAKRKTELGECIYLEGIKAQSGCQECGVPREFCQRWQRKHGEWVVVPSKQCQYKTLVYDTVVGLFHCGDDLTTKP
jgi:hypothetical protein